MLDHPSDNSYSIDSTTRISYSYLREFIYSIRSNTLKHNEILSYMGSVDDSMIHPIYETIIFKLV